MHLTTRNLLLGCWICIWLLVTYCWAVGIIWSQEQLWTDPQNVSSNLVYDLLLRSSCFDRFWWPWRTWRPHTKGPEGHTASRSHKVTYKSHNRSHMSHIQVAYTGHKPDWDQTLASYYDVMSRHFGVIQKGICHRLYSAYIQFPTLCSCTENQFYVMSLEANVLCTAVTAWD